MNIPGSSESTLSILGQPVKAAVWLDLYLTEYELHNSPLKFPESVVLFHVGRREDPFVNLKIGTSAADQRLGLCIDPDIPVSHGPGPGSFVFTSRQADFSISAITGSKPCSAPCLNS